MSHQISKFRISSGDSGIITDLFPSANSHESARVQVNLLVDPVLHGWIKTLRIVNYLIALPKKLKIRFHLIPEKKCSI